MPGIRLVAREMIQPRSTYQMCGPSSRAHLSEEEESVAERSFSVYCKPVELYNVLQHRDVINPLFLQRCLNYKIQAKRHNRVQMTISLSGSLNEGSQVQRLLPFHMMLARIVSDVQRTEVLDSRVSLDSGISKKYSAVYRLTRERVLTTTSTVDGLHPVQAKFILPDMSGLAAEVKSGTLFILFISYVETNSCDIDRTKDYWGRPSLSCDIDKTKDYWGRPLFAYVGKHCLLGKVPMESLFLSWERSPNLSLGERVEIMSTVDFLPCFLEPGGLREDEHISFQLRNISVDVSTFKLVQVIISAEVLGVKERSPYDFCVNSKAPASSMSCVSRLRSGNVIFNYRYYNNRLQKAEVTEDFSCPFCLIKCGSFKGLRYHLISLHDLFNFEFWVTEQYQAVNVSVITGSWNSKVLADGVDPTQQSFFFCSKPLKRRKSKILLCNEQYVHPLAMISDIHPMGNEIFYKVDDAHSSKCGRGHSSSAYDSQTAVADPESTQSANGHQYALSTVLQFAKTRKLSIEQSERSRVLLERRQFFHSHRAQPMEMPQVLSDCDSEDEVDDDVADLEDQRMLEDFVDVTKEEKQMMHLWNSFVRRQRVLADAHIPWACEAFSRFHACAFGQSAALVWCWKSFMIKLWNHGLLDARTMNNCYTILEECQSLVRNGG